MRRTLASDPDGPADHARVHRPPRVRHRRLARDPRAGRARASCRRRCGSPARARWSRSASRTSRAPGYAEAAAAARDHGFEAVKRLAGGRAAVFHEQTVAFAWAERNSDPWPGTHDRFRDGRRQRSSARSARSASTPAPARSRASTARASTRSTPAAQTKLVGHRPADHQGRLSYRRGDRGRRRATGCATCWCRSTRRSGSTGIPARPAASRTRSGPVAFEDVVAAIRAELPHARGGGRSTRDTLALAERLEPEHLG